MGCNPEVLAFLVEERDLGRWREVDKPVQRICRAYFRGQVGVPPVRYWRKWEGEVVGKRGGSGRESRMGRPVGRKTEVERLVERGGEREREGEGGGRRGEGVPEGGERSAEKERESEVGSELGSESQGERLDVGEVGSVGRALIVDAKSPMRTPVLGECEGSADDEVAAGGV